MADLSQLSNISYTRKPVTVLAPDALVFVNGDLLVTTCSQCQQKITLDDITDVSVALAIDGAPGSASVNIAAPEHSSKNYFRFGRLNFSPMQEIEIFAKGRFYVGEKREIRYYPIFWGFITGASYDYSGGAHTISLTCKDILYWWSLSPVTIVPSLASAQHDPPGATSNLMTHTFFNKNPFEIIYALNDNQTGFSIIPRFLDNTFTTAGFSGKSTNFTQLNENLIDYWKQRLGDLREGGLVSRNLRVLGAEGVPLAFDANGDLQRSSFQKENTRKSTSQEANAVSGLPTDVQKIGFSTEAMTAFIPFTADQFGAFGEFDSQMTTALDVANQVKRWIGFEFFMDVTGDIIFKPPFYNLDVRPNFPVSTILDTDIISMSFSESGEEVITRLEITGKLLNDAVPQTVRGYYIDYQLSKKFGSRYMEQTMNLFKSAEACFAFAVSEMDRINSRRFKANVTIPMRPELKLGYPIYMEAIDTFFYVEAINHNLSFGDTALTILTLTAARKKYLSVDENGNVKGHEKGLDGKAKGHRSRALQFTGDTEEPKADIREEKKRDFFEDCAPENPVEPQVSDAIRGVTDLPAIETETAADVTERQKKEALAAGDPQGLVNQQKGATSTEIARMNDNLERNVIGNSQGIWDEVTISTLGNSRFDLLKVLPISDDEGYELVGAVRYGRGLTVTIDGRVLFEPQGNTTGARAIAKRLNKITPDLLETNLFIPDSDLDTNRNDPLSVTTTALSLTDLIPDRATPSNCDCSASTGPLTALRSLGRNR